MAAPGEDEQGTVSIGSTPVADLIAYPGSQEEKKASGAAAKYTKSAASLGSRGSEGEVGTKPPEIETKPAGLGSRGSEGEVGTKPPEIEIETKPEEIKASAKHQTSGDGAAGKTAGPSASFKVYSNSSPTTGSRSSKSKSKIKTDKKFKHPRHSLWYRLRYRITHMGVVEVNSKHPFYHRLKAISAGVSAMLNDPERSASLHVSLFRIYYNNNVYFLF